MKREGKQSGGCLGVTIAFSLLMLPLLYLLSIGPAALLMASGYVPGPAFGRFFYPITWLGEKAPWFDAAMAWYLDLWI